MYGPLGQHADSVVAPLLVPDVPVVTWWPDEAPEIPAKHPLGALAQRRVTDAAAAESPRAALAALAAAYQPGDTDFGWTRATPWRSLLAATFDQPHPPVTAGEIAAEADNPTADLIAAWLSLRLGVPVSRVTSGGPGITGATFSTPDGDISITRFDGRTATLAWPGRVDRHGRPAPQGHGGAAGGGTAPPGPGRGLRETLAHVDVPSPGRAARGRRVRRFAPAAATFRPADEHAAPPDGERSP